jgi:Xaa-Pro aminopeptidase
MDEAITMTSEHNAPFALRLIALRAALAAAGLDGFIIPHADEHLGEYLPPSAERLAFISGFTGSAGIAIVLADRAAIFSDGRYTLQLAEQTDPQSWERHHVTDSPPQAWLQAHGSGKKIGYDPWLVSADFLKRFAGAELVPVDENPVDAIWPDRPAPPAGPATPHGAEYAGEDAGEKRARIGKILADAGQDAAILTDPASLAWAFNIRGDDVEFTPIALGFAIINADGTASIFMAPEKMPGQTREFISNQVTVQDRAALPAALAALTGKTVRYDPAAMPVWFSNALTQAGAKIAEGSDPVSLPRACKNEVEQAGIRAAHLRDGVAMVRFLAWLDAAAPAGRETEISAAAYLLAQRARGAKFRGESFAAISGAGPHGAIIHYRVTPESNRAINPNEVYLIDSGGQYLDGTTDITRTIWTGPGAAPAEIKSHVTAVLAGNIALAMCKFPEGVAGGHLDALARTALWSSGLDYDHGTGHGVGAYLSVHEGPAGISRAARPVPLAAGMVLSNEPGYYLEGSYGIRLENLMLVQPAPFPDQQRKFLEFEILTLAPFDRALIDAHLLSPGARAWLNQYHARVQEMLRPCLQQAEDAGTLNWLAMATAPL